MLIVFSRLDQISVLISSSTRQKQPDKPLTITPGTLTLAWYSLSNVCAACYPVTNVNTNKPVTEPPSNGSTGALLSVRIIAFNLNERSAA